MNISYKWLKKFVNIERTPEEIVAKLTACSFEVENILKQGEGLEKVVVGEVVSKEKHPDADKLSLTKVKVSESDVLDIVCGAPNVEVGQKVAVALVGAKIPCGLEIQERTVRGAKSCGMICAEDELGLGSSHEGIMVLDENLKIGTLVKEALGLDDVIFEIDILPNRAHDCLCHYGVAREVATLFDLELEIFDLNLSTPAELKNDLLEIDVQDKKACRRYSAGVMQGVEVKDSPEWMKSLLVNCGLRPISNLVDITNYMMFSFGQPMHVFDADKVKGKIVVRKAKKGEKILALDEVEYELDENDLVICDSEKPIAIAGVIGGKDSAVGEGTKNIIFESANFEGVGVRKTAQRLKISTDASYRFERDIDPEMTIFCLKEATRLAEELAGGQSVGEILDVYVEPVQKREIEFDFSRIENLLGIEVPEAEVKRVLGSIGFGVEVMNEKVFVTVPTHRIDVVKINDVLEEIARIYGYENIEAKNAETPIRQVKQEMAWVLDRKIKNALEGIGFVEVYNHSFVSEKDLRILNLENALELKNYLTEDAKFFRPTLLAGLLRNAAENGKYREIFGVFELGKIASEISGKVLERKVVAGVLYSKQDKNGMLFSAGKGYVEAFFKKLHLDEVFYSKDDKAEIFWHTGRLAQVGVGDVMIGKIGEIHPQILEEYDVKGKAFYFELSVQELEKVYSRDYDYKAINRLPMSEFDLSVVLDREVTWADVEKAVATLGVKEVVDLKPFDVYEGAEIGDNKKSLAFRVALQAEDRTLADLEIKEISDKIINKMEEMGGKIRK
jgi:phenylalanyl-tRNA synthetase beta chain